MSMANTIETNSTVKTTAVFSKNRKDRYLLKAEWDSNKKSLAIIMTYPSSADELIFDQTTMLVRNGAVKNDFGSVSIINLFSSIDNPLPKTDKTNTSFVMRECDNADVIIVAYGRSTSFEEEKKAFLNALTEHYKDKLHTIIDSKGLMFSYPLSPFAHQWNIQKLDLKR